MTKELEALERLAMPDDLHIKECKKLGISLTKDYEVVEQALLELESIKEANPSEALKCLENLFSNVVSTTYNRESSLKDFNTIKQVLLKAEEEHKVLEIIKEKNVDVFRFKKLDFDTFNQLQKSCKLPELTQEEFNLLKEMLE